MQDVSMFSSPFSILQYLQEDPWFSSKYSSTPATTGEHWILRYVSLIL